MEFLDFGEIFLGAERANSNMFLNNQQLLIENVSYTHKLLSSNANFYVLWIGKSKSFLFIRPKIKKPNCSKFFTLLSNTMPIHRPQ